MSVAVIHFHETIQDSQDFGSSDEHMVSRVYFSIEVDGRRFDDLTVDVKQAVGESYETGPLEVARPQAYKGPLDYAAFGKEVEAYYRRCVGSGTSGIRVGPGARSIRMLNKRIRVEHRAEVPYDEGATG